ncbi:MAG: serine hydrolase, partial [Pyrinomonadaceae bacterium]
DYLRDALFKPLEMNSTRTTTTTDLVQDRANGYGWREGKYFNSAIYLALRPSGAFLSNVLDLAKWDAALYTDRFLKQATREQMWTAVKLNGGTTQPYGFGWELDTVGGHKLVHHGGTLPGFRAEIARFMDDKLTVIVLTNSNNADPDSMALDVADLYIPSLIPERIAARVDPKVFDAYVGQYQANSSAVLTVTREGDKLMAQQGSGEKWEWLPESEVNFFAKGGNRRQTFTFVKDDKGQVTHLVVLIEGREEGRAKKIK